MAIPLDLSPKLWLAADMGVTQSGGTVSAWADQSGNGNNAVQATTVNQPSFVANVVGSLPGIQFLLAGGNWKYMLAAFTALQEPHTICFAAQFLGDGNTGYAPEISYEPDQSSSFDSGSPHYITTTPRWGAIYPVYPAGTSVDPTGTAYSVNETYLYSLTVSTTHWYAFKNGVAEADSTVSTSSTPSFPYITGLRLGAQWRGNRNSYLNLFEVLVFPTVLGTTDRQSVESYLGRWMSSATVISLPVLTAAI
jgi:hypothetical protein